jgi:hypothetical protein
MEEKIKMGQEMRKQKEFLKKAFNINGTCSFIEGTLSSNKFKLSDTERGVFYVTLSLKE